MKFRKILAVLLALAVFTALCACGNEKPEEPAAAPAAVPAATSEPKPVTQEPTQETAPDSDIRPEFKNAMDSYIAFYEEYAEVIEKYSENPYDPSILAEYADMLTKAADMEQKFSEWDESELSDEELKYYMEVTSKILKITAEIEQSMADLIPVT